MPSKILDDFLGYRPRFWLIYRYRLLKHAQTIQSHLRVRPLRMRMPI